jgi:hypothetical protein
MDLYFEDVDCYISVEPEDFSETFVVDAEISDAAADLLITANELDEVGFSSLANTMDSILMKLAAKYHGRTVTLNKPFRTPKGPKKFSVYTKNEKGNVVKVNFGDPNMEIKRDIPARRKSFRARHKCDNPGPKWKARYWSCRMW